MRYLVFDNEQSALDADISVFAEIVSDFEGDGGSSDAQGLIGKDKGGQDRPDKTRTVRWSIPMTRLDGKWVLVHPENYGMTERPGKQGLVAKMLRNFNSTPVEEYSDNWFADEVAPITQAARAKLS